MHISKLNLTSLVKRPLSAAYFLDSDPTGVVNDKITARFNELSPEAQEHGTVATKERWKKMVEAYRFNRLLLVY
jgi:hypothetical protein